MPSRPYPFSCPKSFFGWMDSTGSTRSSQYVFTASPGALAGGQEGADMLMAHSARARRRVAHVARRLLSIHYGPDAARLQELLARSLVRGAPSCRTRARAGVPRLRAAGAPRRPRRSRGASRCSPRGERRCRCARRCPSARRVQQAPRRAEGGLRGAQRRYRDILRHSLLYTWDNERGQPWCAPALAPAPAPDAAAAGAPVVNTSLIVLTMTLVDETVTAGVRAAMHALILTWAARSLHPVACPSFMRRGARPARAAAAALLNHRQPPAESSSNPAARARRPRSSSTRPRCCWRPWAT